MTQTTGAGTARLTRSQVAAALGASVATVRRLEGIELHPSIDAEGVHLFEAAEVEAVARTRQRRKPRKRPPREAAAAAKVSAGAPPSQPRLASGVSGEVAADVFAALDAGRKPSEIVVTLRQPPETVRTLHEAWLELRALDLNAPQAGRRLGELERRMASAEAVVARLAEASNANTAHLAALPVPAAGAFVCSDCGTTGLVAVPVVCTACLSETRLGFWPTT